MDVLAKNLEVGQIMKIEYGSKHNYVRFTVLSVDVGDVTIVSASSKIGNETLVFSNNEKLKIMEEK